MDKDNNGLHLSQSGYEKELLDRWNVGGGSEFPMFKLSEADFETVESVDAGVLKEAQALAGGLLWLSTKSRPDLSYGVSTMSRLMTRNPQKALDVGHALLRYLKSNPGDLHYTRDIAKDGWGERRFKEAIAALRSSPTSPMRRERPTAASREWQRS